MLRLFLSQFHHASVSTTMDSTSVLTLCLLLCVLASGQNDELSPGLLSFVQSQERVVLTVADEVSKLHSNRARLTRRCECSTHICSNEFVNSECAFHLGTPPICSVDGRRVDNSTTIFRAPPGQDPKDFSDNVRESICVYRNLIDVYKDFGFDEVAWIYFASRDGVIRRYPASAAARGLEDGDQNFGGCPEFDPRVRPWYIAASTGPKDIVLVVDKSQSMTETIGKGTQTKWQLTQQAVNSILETFTFADFINVVTFSSGAKQLWEDSGLVRGDKANLEILKEAMSMEKPIGRTNFPLAFLTAFRLLTEACVGDRPPCSNCQKIIVFLTDGEDSSEDDSSSVRPSVMANLIERQQQRLFEATGKRASIFTISMSDDADDAIPRQIACSNNGAWSFIGPDTNTLDALNSYSLYIAGGRNTEKPVWVEPFLDVAGLGNISTVSVPVYAKGAEDAPDIFLGVAGHDVLLNEFEQDGFTQKEALNAIIDRSLQCTAANNTACTFQVFRSSQDPRSICADPFPVVTEPLTDANQDEPFVECYSFENRFYKRFSDIKSWNDAELKCREEGGALVSISSDEELAFLASLSSLDGSWVGLKAEPFELFNWLDTSLPPLVNASNYWGIGEPRNFTEDSACAYVDTRGIVANMGSRPCDQRLSYICKYRNRRNCTAGVVELPRKGFYNIPPLDLCTADAANEVEQIIPTNAVKKLKPRDIMCSLGPAETTEAVTCCEDPNALEADSESPMVVEIADEDGASFTAGMHKAVMLATVIGLLLLL